MAKDKTTRERELLVSLLETIAGAISEMEYSEEYDCGPLWTAELRFMPSFEFTKEEMETIKEVAEDEGMDFSMIVGDDEEGGEA